MYNFANQYRGKYSDSIPNAFDFYRSWTGYGDELGWSAAWLLRATGDQRYQVDVERHYLEFGLNRQLMHNLVNSIMFDRLFDGQLIILLRLV